MTFFELQMYRIRKVCGAVASWFRWNSEAFWTGYWFGFFTVIFAGFAVVAVA